MKVVWRDYYKASTSAYSDLIYANISEELGHWCSVIIVRMYIWSENQRTVSCIKIGWLDQAHNKQEENFLQQNNGGSTKLAKSIGNHIGFFAFDSYSSTFTCALVNIAKLLHSLGEKKKTLQWSAEWSEYF